MTMEEDKKRDESRCLIWDEMCFMEEYEEDRKRDERERKPRHPDDK